MPTWTVSIIQQEKLEETYATIFTLFPLAFSAICELSLAALSSILPNAGTEAVITSTPLAARAWVIPLQ
jgi:hypothetical protein